MSASPRFNNLKMQASKQDKRAEYEILSQIGSGTYSNVYKAIYKPDGKVVAIKVIDISEMDKAGIHSVLNEVRILSSISNPHIVEYYEAFVDPKENYFWIVMEFLGGGDLASVISSSVKSGEVIDETRVWTYAVQVLRGISELHKLKIVHRDIKPANIFLTGDKRSAKIGDLNVSKVLKQDLTRTQIGTPYYLAPEIWNKKAYDFKADIFSLGALLYELAALRHPHEARTSNELHHKLMNEEIVRIPDGYSEELSAIIMKCLVREQVARPSAEQLLNSRIIKKKIEEYALCAQNSDKIDDDNFLSDTIVVPKKLSLLNRKLPQRTASKNPSYLNSKVDSNGLTNELTNDSIKSHRIAKVTVRDIRKPQVPIIKKKECSPERPRISQQALLRKPSVGVVGLRCNSRPALLSRENSVKRSMLTDRPSKFAKDRARSKTSVEQVVKKCPVATAINKKPVGVPPIAKAKQIPELPIEKLKTQNSNDIKPIISERVNPPLRMPKHISNIYAKKTSESKLDKPETKRVSNTSVSKLPMPLSSRNRYQSPGIAKYAEKIKKMTERENSPKQKMKMCIKKAGPVNRSCA